MSLTGSGWLLTAILLGSLPVFAQNAAQQQAPPPAPKSGQSAADAGQTPAAQPAANPEPRSQPTDGQPAPKSGAAPSPAEDVSQKPSKAAVEARTAAIPESDLKKHAWDVLRAGIADKNNLKHAATIKALALMKGQSWAVTHATEALDDKSVDVRSAGALALGELRATSTIPKLKGALSDKEPRVVLAAARSLVQMKDQSGYDVYYAILTGQMKGSKGLIAGELDTLKDPKKLALLGFEQGIGYVPFASLGYSAVRTVMKDEGAPGRAAAARVLLDDPDPDSLTAIADAGVGDKSELVRVAALETIAKRGDPIAILDIAPAMYDDKDAVKFTASAAVLHLEDVKDQKSRVKPPGTSKKKK